jgi:hypothetical protein
MQVSVHLPSECWDALRRHLAEQDLTDNLAAVWDCGTGICGGAIDLTGGVFQPFTWDRKSGVVVYPVQNAWNVVGAIRTAAVKCEEIEMARYVRA